MAQQYPNSWKQCATCAFWTGERECDRFGQRVTVASAMTKGRCAIPKGGLEKPTATGKLSMQGLAEMASIKVIFIYINNRGCETIPCYF